MSSAICFNLDLSKVLSPSNGLKNLFQTIPLFAGPLKKIVEIVVLKREHAVLQPLGCKPSCLQEKNLLVVCKCSLK